MPEGCSHARFKRLSIDEIRMEQTGRARIHIQNNGLNPPLHDIEFQIHTGQIQIQRLRGTRGHIARLRSCLRRQVYGLTAAVLRYET